MLEVIVPPTPAQLAAAGDPDPFVRTARPRSSARAMSELLAAGLDPELWKVEGVDDPAAAAGSPPRARPTGAPPASWCSAPARRWHASTTGCASPPAPGFAGFAVGRSLWWQEIRDLLAGRPTGRRPSPRSPRTSATPSTSTPTP